MNGDKEKYFVAEVDEGKKKIAQGFQAILKSVSVAGWELEKTTTNFMVGVSVYGYFNKVGSNPVQRLKIRISDHAGRWSGANLDLRNPKDANAIINLLTAKNKGF